MFGILSAHSMIKKELRGARAWRLFCGRSSLPPGMGWKLLKESWVARSARLILQGLGRANVG